MPTTKELINGIKFILEDLWFEIKCISYSLFPSKKLEETITERADLQSLEQIEIDNILADYRNDLEAEGIMSDEDINSSVDELKNSLMKGADNE